MTECDVQILSAYHDDELDADARARVAAHVRTCPSCASALAEIADASRLLREAPLDDLSAAQLANLHEAVDDVDDYRLWRIGGSLGLVAASILIIGMAWLNAIPAAGAGAGAGAGGAVVTAPPSAAQPWERTAVTLRVYPPLPSNDQAIQPHDAQFADYMLDGLAMGK